MAREVGILVLSQYVETTFALRLVADGAGGVGYLLKDRVDDLEDFADAIRRIARGGSVIDPEVVAQLVGRRRAKVPLDDLTEREREVLALMAEGRSNQAICDRLFLAPKTVEAHIANIFSKLELVPAPDDHRRVLAVLAHLRGWRRPRLSGGPQWRGHRPAGLTGGAWYRCGMLSVALGPTSRQQRAQPSPVVVQSVSPSRWSGEASMTTQSPAGDVLVEMEGISKTFPGVHALDGARFELRARRGPRRSSARTAPASRR